MRVAGDEHAWVPRAELERLAGPRAGDPAWSAGLDRMVEFARGRGWLRDDGAIRAHVERD